MILALSSLAWAVAAALAVLSLAVLARVTLGLVGRLKELNRTLQGASGRLNEALDEVRTDLDRVTEGVEGLRRRREEASGPGSAAP